MDHADILVADALYKPEKHGQSEHGENVDGAAVGKIVDEFGNRIVGHHILQQFTFVYPSLRELVAGHFHPNGVGGVAWDIHHLGHDELVAALDAYRVVDHRAIVGQSLQGWGCLECEGVGGLEVVARPVVVADVEVHGVDTPFAAGHPVVRLVGMGIVARREQHGNEGCKQHVPYAKAGMRWVYLVHSMWESEWEAGRLTVWSRIFGRPLVPRRSPNE